MVCHGNGITGELEGLGRLEYRHICVICVGNRRIGWEKEVSRITDWWGGIRHAILTTWIILSDQVR